MVTVVDCVGRRSRSQVSPEPWATPLGPRGVFQAGTCFKTGQSQTSLTSSGPGETGPGPSSPGSGPTLDLVVEFSLRLVSLQHVLAESALLLSKELN